MYLWVNDAFDDVEVQGINVDTEVIMREQKDELRKIAKKAMGI